MLSTPAPRFSLHHHRALALGAMGLAFAPGFAPYWTYVLADRPHLQFALLAPLVSAFLFTEWCGEPLLWEPGPIPISVALLGAAAAGLGPGSALESSFIWAFSLALASVGAIRAAGGIGLLRRVWPAAAFLLLMVPPPLGLIARLLRVCSSWRAFASIGAFFLISTWTLIFSSVSQVLMFFSS